MNNETIIDEQGEMTPEMWDLLQTLPKFNAKFISTPCSPQDIFRPRTESLPGDE